MFKYKNVLLVTLAVIILIGGTGFTAQPAYASGCRAYHTVRWGETLSSIGWHYGVSWPHLAQVNGIPWPYHVFAGQVLCIPTGSGGYWYGTGGYPTYPTYPTSGRTWSFTITSVSPNTKVTIQTYNMPDYVKIQVRMGFVLGNEWVQMTDIDTGAGGNLSVDIPIPAQFANKTPLTVRLTQVKKNGKSFWQDQTFNNVTGGSGTGGYPGTAPVYCPGCYYGWGIPTIWIVGVQRDNSVTIQTHNFPANTSFDVLMGPMGSRAIGGYYVTSFNSGGGGSFQMTFSIPPQLYGSRQIAIRTQSPGTGFFSYNWFFNNTTY